ncbi:something about silencing protein 10 [Anthonomus grandis grandis]|uniref:something about silencing protein 10 n=1 Tax=Anthonomus grandis grandis TaxID=2921223 RepID=UPI0021655357|nr:something about silencing protein 10 [Anthonomus grandis grandis]
MPFRKRFQDEEDDILSSSSEDEKKLRKFRDKHQLDEQSDSEVEVLGVGSDNDSSDQSDIALSDVEGQQDDDDLPDVRAWGKEKKKYYGADYVDADYGGWGKEAHAAEIEEEEVKNLQSQLIQQLDDNDFSLDVVLKKPTKKEEAEEVIKTDLSQLSNKQKLAILKKESSEFFSLVEDFKNKMTLAKDYLKPILELVKSGKMEHCRTVDLVQTYYQLILNYSINIYMYLLLKGNNKLKNHPIIQKLYQYRQLLSEIEPVFEEIVKPQIECILSEEKQTEAKSEMFELVKSLKNSKTKPLIEETIPSKKMKLDSEPSEDTEDIGKRAITYQIAKNKGTQLEGKSRKKGLKNPRVKYKLKLRKALIKRKGAVREPRKELSRYSGEISGIKTSVKKSIKLKS